MKANNTARQQAIAHFIKHPNADPTAVAKKYMIGRSNIYQYRKVARKQVAAPTPLEDETAAFVAEAAKQVFEAAKPPKKVKRPYNRRAKAAPIPTTPYPTPGPDIIGFAEAAAADTIQNLLDERHNDYGLFLNSARTAQRIKLALRDNISAYPVDFDQLEALDMIASKLARIANGNPNSADQWIDIIGYSTLVVDRLKGIAR